MRSREGPFHGCFFPGPVVDQFKGTAPDVPAAVDGFKVGSGPEIKFRMSGGRLHHLIESGGSGRNHSCAVRLEMLENMGFFPGDPFQRAEIFQMAAPDGDNQSRIRFHRGGQRFNLAGMVCPHFNDADFMAGSQTQKILRNSDLIVRVAFRRQDMFFAEDVFEYGTEHLLGTGFSAGTGQGDRFDSAAFPVEGRQALIRRNRGIHGDGGSSRGKFSQ